jgi:hypothetical protein
MLCACFEFEEGLGVYILTKTSGNLVDDGSKVFAS